MVLVMMTRKRTIEPDFYTRRGVTRVSPLARLLVMGLRSYADDEGRMRGDPRLIAGALYPCDGPDVHAQIPGWLDELEREKLIERYVVDDEVHIRIVDWYEHQCVDRPTPSKLPASPQELANPREA